MLELVPEPFTVAEMSGCGVNTPIGFWLRHVAKASLTAIAEAVGGFLMLALPAKSHD